MAGPGSGNYWGLGGGRGGTPGSFKSGEVPGPRRLGLRKRAWGWTLGSFKAERSGSAWAWGRVLGSFTEEGDGEPDLRAILKLELVGSDRVRCWGSRLLVLGERRG